MVTELYALKAPGRGGLRILIRAEGDSFHPHFTGARGAQLGLSCGSQFRGARTLVRPALLVARTLGPPREQLDLAGPRGIAQDRLHEAVLARVIGERDDA